LAFLLSYKTHPDAHKVNGPLLAEFIESLNRVGELTSWTVVFIGGGGGASINFNSEISLAMFKRSMKGGFDKNRYSIGRLMSSRDEAIDMDDASWNAALTLTRKAWQLDPGRKNRSKEEPDVPNGPAIRRVRGFGYEKVNAQPDRGILFVYGIDPLQDTNANFENDTPGIIAFGLSFPGSDSGLKVEYKVNNVLWELEYGSAD
jgi:hypothetical protein